MAFAGAPMVRPEPQTTYPPKPSSLHAEHKSLNPKP